MPFGHTLYITHLTVITLRYSYDNFYYNTVHLISYSIHLLLLLLWPVFHWKPRASHQLYKLFITPEYSTINSLYLFVFLTHFFSQLSYSLILITDKLFFCDKRHESIILNIFIPCYIRVERKMIYFEEKNSKKKLKYYKNKILVWNRV